MRSYLFTSLFLLIGISLSAQTIDQARLEALTEKEWQSGLSLLNELVSMPNDAVYPEQIAVNIAWCEAAFSKRNWTVDRLETGGIPLLSSGYQQVGSEKRLPTCTEGTNSRRHLGSTTDGKITNRIQCRLADIWPLYLR